MAYRKHKNGQQVRRQFRRVVKNVAEARRLDKLLASAEAEAWRKFREGKAGCITIGDKLEEFVADSVAGLNGRRRGYQTLRRHRRRLELFNQAFQRKPLDAIDRERVERWIRRRLADGVCADTVNIDLQSLYAFTRWAQRKKLAPSVIPYLAIGRLDTPGKLAGKNQRPPKARELPELKRIIHDIKARRVDLGEFLLGMAYFGLRPAAVASMRREDATLPRAGEVGRIRARGLKGGLPRELALPPGSGRAAWVRRCLKLGKALGRDKPRDPLVPCQGRRSTINPGGWTTESFDMALARLCARLKPGFTAYQIRHTCMTWLQTRREMAMANTQGYAGHKNVTTQNVYSHRHNRDAEAAYQLMEMELEGL